MIYPCESPPNNDKKKNSTVASGDGVESSASSSNVVASSAIMHSLVSTTTSTSSRSSSSSRCEQNLNACFSAATHHTLPNDSKSVSDHLLWSNDSFLSNANTKKGPTTSFVGGEIEEETKDPMSSKSSKSSSNVLGSATALDGGGVSVGLPASAEAAGVDNNLNGCDFLYRSINPLFSLGANIDISNLGEVPEGIDMNRVGTLFQQLWQEERDEFPGGSDGGSGDNHAKPSSLVRPLRKLIGLSLLLPAMMFQMVGAASIFSIPLLQQSISKHVSGEENPVQSTRVYHLLIALLFVCPVVGSVCRNQASYMWTFVALKARNALISAIYKKCLSVRLSAKHSTGEIISLFTVDTYRIEHCFRFAATAFFCPFQIAVALYLIWREVNVSMFACFVVIVVILPFLMLSFFGIAKFYRQKQLWTDKRVKLTTDVLNGIRIVKFYHWEAAFEKAISVFRDSEAANLLRVGAYWTAANLLLAALPALMSVLVFLTYIKLGHSLEYGKAVTVLQLFAVLQMPLFVLPDAINEIVMASVSMGRILAFLHGDDSEVYVSNTSTDFDAGIDADTAICFENASFGWLLSSEFSEKLEDKKEVKDTADAPSITKHYGGLFSKVTASGKVGYASVVSVKVLIDKRVADARAAADADLRAYNSLVGVNLCCKKGRLYGIVGSVGSGKSTLLCALLNQLNLHRDTLAEGKVYLDGSVAYCSQQPWILNDTVKENILFGSKYNSKLLNKVIDLSCLSADIKTLAAGLNTEIGEKGINLSGGQKARIAFARALYRNADIYLLDDPLSAVDAMVGSKMFNDGILNFLLGQGKTVLLVTHQVHFLTHCEDVIVVNDGRIVGNGSYSSLRKTLSGLSLFEALDTDGSGLIDFNELYSGMSSLYPQLQLTPADVRVMMIEADTNFDGKISFEEFTNVCASANGKRTNWSNARSTCIIANLEVEELFEGQLVAEDASKCKLIKDEERAKGRVDKSILHWWVKHGSISAILMVFICCACAQAATVKASFWLKHWGEAVVKTYMVTGSPPSSSSNIQYFIKYAWLALIEGFTVFVMAICSILQTYMTGKFFHQKMLHSILSAPTAFFDGTPLGRIVNRFSSDVMMADHEVGNYFQHVVQTVARLIAALVVVAIATSGYFVLLIVPICILYYIFYLRYVSVNIELSRLDLLAKTPLMVNFSQTIDGVHTIKAYNEVSRFYSKICKSSSDHSVVTLNLSKIQFWLDVRLCIFGSLLTFGLAVFQAVLHDMNKENIMNADDMQLAITFSQTIPLLAGSLIQYCTSFEKSLTSIERIKEYVERVQSELSYLASPIPNPSEWNSTTSASAASEGGNSNNNQSENESGVELTKISAAATTTVPGIDWPNRGEVVFENISLGYRDGPDVLKGVSFSIRAREKVGIVGRTGSGKSTIMTALFRMERFRRGRVLIDGIDISTISLSDLRSRVCIIPQDPVMFASTVRLNLDPFLKYSDDDLWAVLQKTKLAETVQKLSLKLEEPVCEGGGNFSLGQRQLICFARALLRKPKILVLDEATASVDNETDLHIQLMIREMFENCTVLTIVHRIHSIMDSDRVMVLKNGVVAEMDSPKMLLENKESLFTSMWNQHNNDLHP